MPFIPDATGTSISAGPNKAVKVIPLALAANGITDKVPKARVANASNTNQETEQRDKPKTRILVSWRGRDNHDHTKD